MAREYEGIANALASRGRNGDSMMIHVSPIEVEYLERIAPELGINLPGGKLPINPDTGQPEAFPFLLGLLAIPGAVVSSVASGVAGAGSALLGGLTGGAIGAAPVAGTSTLGAMGSALMGSAGTASSAGSGLLGAGTAIESGLMGVVNTFGGGGWQGFLQGTLGEGIAGALTGGTPLSGTTQAGLAEITAGQPELASAYGLDGSTLAAGETPGSLFPTVGEGAVEMAIAGEPLAGTDMLAQVGEAPLTYVEPASLPAGYTPPTIQGPPTGPTTPTLPPGGEQAVEPTFMEQVNEGIQLIRDDPLKAVGKAAGKVVQTAADNPYETMGLAMAADALDPGDGGGEEKVEQAGAFGAADNATYAEQGTGGGDIVGRQDYIAESGVPDSLYPSPSNEMLSDTPEANRNMLARRAGVMDEGIGMMQVGSPEVAAPVGIAEREIPGQEEAFEMFAEEDFDPSMSIDEMIDNLPEGMTMKDLEEFWAMYGPDAIGGMV